MEFRPDSLGNLLSDMYQRIDQNLKSSIENVDASMDLKIQTAEDLGLAIENVKNAYKDSLDCTIDKTTSTVQEVFNKLKAIVEKFEQPQQENMPQLINEAQELVSSLSFSYSQPKLSSVSRYLVIDDVINHVSLVTFKGQFPWSETQGFEPSLTVSGYSCHLVNRNKESLTFKIPQAIFTDSSPAHYSYQIGALQVPWDAGWVRSHKTQFDYKVYLGALPQIAGKGSVVFLSDQERIEEFEMNWKDSKLLEPKENEKISKVIFTDYKKIKQEHGEASIDPQHILQISVEENGAWKIWAEPPKDLSALSEKIPEEKIAVKVEVSVEENKQVDIQVDIQVEVSEIIQEQTPVESNLTLLGNKLYDLYSLLTTWRSTPLAEQSAGLLEDVEKLQSQLSQSTISQKDAEEQLEKLSQSMLLLQEDK